MQLQSSHESLNVSSTLPLYEAPKCLIYLYLAVKQKRSMTSHSFIPVASPTCPLIHKIRFLTPNMLLILDSIFLLFSFFFFGFSATLGYAQVLLLALCSRDHIDFRGQKLNLLLAKQTPYFLCYLCSPSEVLC